MDGVLERIVIPALSANPCVRRPRVVIIGAGFGGLSAALRLGRVGADVTVIDRRNHHLFQPLLYQVATAALSPADIAAPIRGILARYTNTDVILGKVTGIDVPGHAVLIGGRRVPYDQLIIATGARESYFGHDDWAAVTSGLKSIEDATTMRRRILVAFERAEDTEDEAERRRLLTFLIIGGGPTGVELAGALAELAKAALVRDFRHIDPTTARIVLVEAAPRLLSSFPPRLSEVAARALERLGVEVRVGTRVTRCDDCGAVLGNERLESRTIIWAAGVAASPAASWLGVEPERGGRVTVGPDLTLPGHADIFVIGDTAQVTSPAGPLPGVAPVAKQQGAYVARVIAARLAGKPPPAAFRYRDFGNLATIGRREAVVDFGRLRLTGRIAWLAWGMAHIYFLIGFRNRMAVAIDWLWSYLSYQRGARLITGQDM
ncbi:MAG: NAD(P)/FAD-dependent oxidoreductase [Alphaproteobacteria bacterium]|nr:NAD(P)/FAD-dependent oxidoreductase [Alphaproteobacteria bacterium]MBV9374288.1 NAD(P)/FAD-dependent oxidoreductase [Alphaproteobacteria bacterium]